jgi:hypothetical protein
VLFVRVDVLQQLDSFASGRGAHVQYSLARLRVQKSHRDH